jgi:hypothetical protein
VAVDVPADHYDISKEDKQTMRLLVMNLPDGGLAQHVVNANLVKEVNSAGSGEEEKEVKASAPDGQDFDVEDLTAKPKKKKRKAADQSKKDKVLEEAQAKLDKAEALVESIRNNDGDSDEFEDDDDRDGTSSSDDEVEEEKPKPRKGRSSRKKK